MFIILLCLIDSNYFFVSGIFNRMVIILIYLLQKKELGAEKNHYVIPRTRSHVELTSN